MSIMAFLIAAALAGGQPAAVGADADKHGCRASAGYSWSPLRGECIRLFESGIRLDPVAPQDGAAVISAFIVFKGDKWAGPLELYVPGGKAPLRLNKRKGNQWTGQGWTVRLKNGAWEARRNGTLIYRGEPA